MRIKELRVKNFRAITKVHLRDLPETIVIAGPNGCGKSCIFDAIRLIKSVYGGYQPNEWQNWFGEFQINLGQRPGELLPLFQNREIPLEVEAEIALSSAETEYLRNRADALLREQAWKEVAPELAGWRYIGGTPLAVQLRAHEPKVNEKVEKAKPDFLQELNKVSHRASLHIGQNGEIKTASSRVLELVFAIYDPQHIGIIDYHGSTRNYNREQVGGINLNLESSEERLRQHALYNYGNKYANLKTEMASGFVRQLLARKANQDLPTDDRLTVTLKELFSTFFPRKEFLGPQPTPAGGLLFPVRTPSGAQHDIDDLSSGEKEVLYGYLRLRNASPRESVLLIDEPELHLNPRLVTGLASFYHRHLGQLLGTQLWLVTHSDTLIREAVGQEGFKVYHMQPPGDRPIENQVTEVKATEDVDRVVIDLVGDLAAYRPGGKLVVFEGGGDSGFDVRMTETLFPEFQIAVNAISGGDKRRVADLYEVIEEVRRAGYMPFKLFAITDNDGEHRSNAKGESQLRWDVYHIENYLLEPCYIRKVMQEIGCSGPIVETDDAVLEGLRSCAKETIPHLVSHRLRTLANKEILRCIDLGSDPAADDPAVAISEAIERSRGRIEATLKLQLATSELEKLAKDTKDKAIADLEHMEWRKTFRGRDVLRRFVGAHGKGLRYEVFRDLIVARMKDAEHKPSGMRTVVEQILQDP